MDFNGKVVVISGAGSGIGKALAINVAKAGSKLAISDINEENLASTVDEVGQMGAQVHSAVLDVVDWDAYQNYAHEVISHYGHVDIVINNAGVALGSFTVDEVTIDQFKWLMDINFWGMVYGTKAFLPHLIKRSEASISNISSILGLGAIAKQAPYCASKFGIRGFTESLRMEAMIDFPHVHVLSIHPGGIQTNIAQNANWAGKELSEEEKSIMAQEFEKTFINTADYAAQDIMKAISKKKNRLLIGKDARAMWRIINWFPVRYTRILYNRHIKKIDEALQEYNS